MTRPLLDFRPLFLLGNPHVQTALGVLLPGRVCPPPQVSRVLRLPDGDAQVLHENTPPAWKPGDPVALLVHGLTGSHLSAHIRRMAMRFLEKGVRVFRLDLRGAGEALPLSRRTYHAGRSEDVRLALEFIHALTPTSPVSLVAVSLGGNIALKLAGEAADHPVPGLVRVAALNPPIDLARCCEMLRHPRNRVYERRFARELVRDAKLRQGYFPDLPPLTFRHDGVTMQQFDDEYTAPRNGFADSGDYYERASAYSLVPKITLPTFVLTARDDPFIAVEPFEELRGRVGDNVTIRIADRGGHIGFIGYDGGGGIRWAEQRVVDWAAG